MRRELHVRSVSAPGWDLLYLMALLAAAPSFRNVLYIWVYNGRGLRAKKAIAKVFSFLRFGLSWKLLTDQGSSLCR